MGTISRRATVADMRKQPGVNFLVKYVNSETGDVIPACDGRKIAFYPQQLDSNNWGVEQLWVLLEKAPDGPMDGSGSVR